MTSEKQEHRAAELAGLVQSTAQLLRLLTHEVASRSGTNDARLGVLQAIGGADDEGCSQTELACRLRQSESNISTLIERMRQDGLLYRLRCKEDRRKRLLRLTEAGSRLLDEVLPGVEARLDAALHELDAETIQRLITGLGDMLRLLESEASGRHDLPKPAARSAA